MDPCIQHMFKKVEQHSRSLSISNEPSSLTPEQPRQRRQSIDPSELPFKERIKLFENRKTLYTSHSRSSLECEVELSGDTKDNHFMDNLRKFEEDIQQREEIFTGNEEEQKEQQHVSPLISQWMSTTRAVNIECPKRKSSDNLTHMHEMKRDRMYNSTSLPYTHSGFSDDNSITFDDDCTDFRMANNYSTSTTQTEGERGEEVGSRHYVYEIAANEIDNENTDPYNEHATQNEQQQEKLEEVSDVDVSIWEGGKCSLSTNGNTLTTYGSTNRIPLNEIQMFNGSNDPGTYNQTNITNAMPSPKKTLSITTTTIGTPVTPKTTNATNMSKSMQTSPSLQVSWFLHPGNWEFVVKKVNDDMAAAHSISTAPLFSQDQENANISNSMSMNGEHSDTDNGGNGDLPSVIVSPNNENADTDEDGDNEQKYNPTVKEQIDRILCEVQYLEQTITRVIQVLNFCDSTAEFADTLEAAASERVLLLATHRRQAYLSAIERLLMKKTIGFSQTHPEKGHLTIKEITFTLRPDYIELLRQKVLPSHYLVCLVKYNEHVLATKLSVTSPEKSDVKFNDIVHLNDVDTNFEVTIEIYGTMAQYINTSIHKKFGITASRKRKLIMMPRPNVTHTPALVKYASVIFSKQDIEKTNWTLTQALSISPLGDVLSMKLNFQMSVIVKYKGFLTIFENVSGVGIWRRCWCYLNGSIIKYWEYPKDEMINPPIGLIDLYNCCSTEITIAPRDICTRLNTMLLECKRPAEPNDDQSIMVIPNGSNTIQPYLLSADTKGELKEWCALLNKALTLLPDREPLTE